MAAWETKPNKMAEAKTQIVTNEVFNQSSQQNRWQYVTNIALCPSLINSALILQKLAFKFFGLAIRDEVA